LGTRAAAPVNARRPGTAGRDRATGLAAPQPSRNRSSLDATDPAHDTVDAVRGDFSLGDAFVAVTPCGANSAAPTCTIPNWLGSLEMATGRITPVGLAGPNLQPQVMTFDPDD
jgi:hypothetical protein